MASNSTSVRLASLDILRGLDLFLLLFLQPVIIAFGRVADWSWLNAVMYQLDHEVWDGFRVWDIIMPLFLFMVGTSMPFSFSRYLFGEQSGRKSLWKRVIRRVILLFLFGMIVQGNLLAFDPSHIYIYTNTLQAIAAGYLIASLIVVNLSRRWQLISTAFLLVLYWLPMRFCGDYSLEGSFAYAVDKVVIGRFHGDPTYTWIWSSLTFGTTVMMGYFAGVMMKDRSVEKRIVALRMAVIGMILIIFGLLWGLEMPIIKRLWTSSMTLFSGGICFMLMSLFFYLIDCCGYSYGLDWLKIYGTNAITAYVIGEVINFRSIVASVSYGLEPYFGAYYSVWLTFGNFLILFLILRLMYKHKLFLKI